MPQAVIVACPRSGTGYVAQVVNAAGVPCGHESVFGLDGYGDWGTLRCDVSWLAAPLLPAESVRVAHQIRNPLRVVRSLVGIRWGSSFREFAERNLPELAAAQSPTEWAVRLWCGWVEMCERHAVATWRVEDLARNHVAADAVGRHVGADGNAIRSAARATATNVNARPHREQADLADVPDDVFSRLADIASYYGYAVRR